MNYEDWLDEVDAEFRAQIGQDLDEQRLSGKLLRSHWRGGDTPQEFVSEMLDRGPIADLEDEPFDIRYDL